MGQQKTRLPVDGLRGLAITMVVLGHTGVLGTAGVGVAWFFVLSAFLLTYRQLATNQNFVNISDFTSFYQKRLKRIIFPYLIILTTYLIFWSQNENFVNFLKYLVLIKNFRPEIWFLQAILAFYLIFPFLYLFNKRLLKENLILITSVTFIFPLLIHLYNNTPNRANRMIFYLANCRAPLEMLTIGMISAYAFYLKKLSPRNFRSLLTLFLLLLIIFMAPIWESFLPESLVNKVQASTFNIFSNPFRIHCAYTLQALLFSLFLYFFLHEKEWLKNIFNNQLLAYIGKYSYEIYLTHFIIYSEILKPLFKVTEEISHPLVILIFLLTMILSLGAAIFIRKLGKRYFNALP